MKSAKRLSTLGFFPSPNTELPKGVTCFYCKLVVDSTENAFDLHLGEAPCSFAKLRRNLKVGDSSFQKQLDKCHPVTIDVTEELLKTFTAWPHGEGRSQTTPTAEEVIMMIFMVGCKCWVHEDAVRS